MAKVSDSILSSDSLRFLEGISLAPRRQLASHLRGERLSRQKGISVEFADYRDYVDGDDLRHLDWNLLARLDRPTIRTYQDEAELPVYVAVDISPSMDFGTPTKLEHASLVAGAIAFIGLGGHDRVQMLQIGNLSQPLSRPMRGRASVRAMLEWLHALRADGRSTLSQSVSRLPALRPGMFFLITDGLDHEFPSAVGSIASRGHELVVVQTLSPAELNPDLEGDLRLIDAESQLPVELTANVETLREYRANLDRHCAELADSVVRHGGRFLTSVVEQPLGDFVRDGLRRAGLVAQ